MSNTEDQIQRCIDKMVAEALEGFFTKGVVEHEVYKERDKLLEENKRFREALEEISADRDDSYRAVQRIEDQKRARKALATAAKEGEVEELVCSKCGFSTTIKHYSCPCCLKTNTHDAGEG